MPQIIKKIKKRLQQTVTAFRSDCTFSTRLAFCRAVDDITHRLHLKKISTHFHAAKDNLIVSFLEDFLHPVIEKYKYNDNTGVCSENAPIWVCWWSGVDSAPPIVKKCIESIRKNANGHPVHLITEMNYHEYLDIPEYIITKVTEKKLGLANFSDYLRFSLIAKYGGLWIDSTIFCSVELSNTYFHFPVFTCKSPERECRYISKYRWTSFCLGGYSGHTLFLFLKEAFEKFWYTYNTAIDYLFVDYLIFLAYKHIPQAKIDLSNVPINNIHRDDLQAAMNLGLPAAQFSEIIQKDTILYKLSWREIYAETTFDGTETVYKFFIGDHCTKA